MKFLLLAMLALVGCTPAYQRDGQLECYVIGSHKHTFSGGGYWWNEHGVWKNHNGTMYQKSDYEYCVRVVEKK